MLDPEQVKADNIALIKSWKIHVVDHLPTLEAEDELVPQAAQSVAKRCIVISHVIGIGFGGKSKKLKQAIEKFDLFGATSAHEKDMLSRRKHTEQEKIDAQWLAECMQSFAWCLGLDKLEPLQYCDDELADRFPEPFTDPSEFISGAVLRPFEEIYQQADLHYRLHWAARNAQLTDTDFPVKEGLIRERRRALDWVIGVESDWDEVPSNT